MKKQDRKKVVCLIIENTKGEILLLLRDDKPEIPYPNKWDIPGGIVEPYETFPLEAIRREMKEEIELEFSDAPIFKIYKWKEKTEYVFYLKIDLDIAKTELHEGQKLQYFSKQEIDTMELAFYSKEILKDYFKWRDEKALEIKRDTNRLR